MSKRTILVLALGSMLALLVGVGVAFAALPGSNFEIDTNANLRVDGAAPALDWANVTESRKADNPSGSSDNSFGNGTKEDTAVPSVVSGSIPPNKSDLLNFGAYLETTPSGARFLNVFWHRVQEPSGTTNMDFEFNQSSATTGNGVTPVRTAGDVLIQYDLSQGGTNPVLYISRWVTSGAGSQCEASNAVPCWSTKTNLSAAGDATGSINSTAISAAQSDGLGAISPRTFGEAQIDFDALSGGSGQCVSFGSAYLKSRSSDSFTAALKDFIAPTPSNLSTCAKVKIRKETNPEESPNATSFGFTKTFPTTPASANTFTLQDDGLKSYTNVQQGGTTNYTVDEDVIPAGWDLQNIDCNVAGHPSSGVTPVINVGAGTVTFAIDSASDVLDCTYTNRAQGNIVIKKVTDPSGAAQSFDFTLKDGPSALNQSFSLTDQQTHISGSVISGNGYKAAETVPAGWDQTSATCSDNSPVGNIDVSPGETVTCTFNNTLQRSKIVVDKVTDPSGDPQSFDFLLSGGPSDPTDNFSLTDAATPHESAPLLPGSGYDVTETVPPDWELSSVSCDSGESDEHNITVEPGETVTCTFNNTKQTTGIATEQSFIPQDKATITGTGSGTFDGTVDFRLFSGKTCGENANALYEDLDNALDANTHTASTDNDGTESAPGALDGYTINGTGGTFSWKVTYEGDPNHPSETSCVEESTLTIDNDNTP
jgi:Prealbumin-like fold domain